MCPDPIELALREIAETKDLLEALTTSAEFFDYAGAKAAIELLQNKVRRLGNVQTQLSAQRAEQARLILEFQPNTLPAA
jgi:hypothetical protein